jgi:hypothetical protein
VTKAVSSGSARRAQAVYDELMELIYKYSR